MKYIDAAAGAGLTILLKTSPGSCFLTIADMCAPMRLTSFNYLPELLGLQSAYDVARAMTEASLLSLTVGSLDIDFNPATLKHSYDHK